MGYRDNCTNDEADAFDKGIERSQYNNKDTDLLYTIIEKLRAENTKLQEEVKNLKRKKS